jgi:hypothetical protein
MTRKIRRVDTEGFWTTSKEIARKLPKNMHRGNLISQEQPKGSILVISRKHAKGSISHYF